jgi:hypothetical protein
MAGVVLDFDLSASSNMNKRWFFASRNNARWGKQGSVTAAKDQVIMAP